jgi:glucokinase
MVIGVDLGGTKVAAARFDAAGNILEKEYELLGGATGEAVAERVVAAVRKVIAPDVTGIGVCVPGIVWTARGTVWAPNIPGWEEFPLLDRLQTAFPGLKVHIGSDRTCYILGEVWKGAAQGCRNAIYLAVGTGIGAGILLDGRIIHGKSDIVGATGWMALQPPYSERYDACGCFETYASGNGIGAQAREALRNAPSYRGVLAAKPVEAVTSRDVFAAFLQNDPIAVAVVDKAVEFWGMATANLVSLFNPEKIIFGGGVFGPGVILIPRIYEEACRWGQPIAMREVRFCASEVGDGAALSGSAYLALKEYE